MTGLQKIKISSFIFVFLRQNEQKNFIPGGDWQAFPANHIQGRHKDFLDVVGII